MPHVLVAWKRQYRENSKTLLFNAIAYWTVYLLGAIQSHMLRNQSGNSTLILFQCSHFSKGQNVPASDGSKKGIWESNLCPAEGTLFLSQVKRDASALLHILTTSGLYLLQYHIFCILLKYILQSNMTMEGCMKFDKGETWKDEAVDLDSLLSADRLPWIH